MQRSTAELRVQAKSSIYLNISLIDKAKQISENIYMLFLRNIYLFLVDTVQTFLIAASVFLVIYIFLFRPFQVNGQSMYPTFIDKEYVLTNLFILKFEKPKRGDVIVFKAPNNKEKDYIKRVIGIPGDTISLNDNNVYLNNRKLDESAYLKDEVKTYAGSFLTIGGEITVPQNQYFVLGDNRSASSDSREWGFVKESEIIGKSFVVYWPPNSLKVVKNPYD